MASPPEWPFLRDRHGAADRAALVQDHVEVRAVLGAAGGHLGALGDVVGMAHEHRQPVALRAARIPRVLVLSGQPFDPVAALGVALRCLARAIVGTDLGTGDRLAVAVGHDSFERGARRQRQIERVVLASGHRHGDLVGQVRVGRLDLDRVGTGRHAGDLVVAVAVAPRLAHRAAVLLVEADLGADHGSVRARHQRAARDRGALVEAQHEVVLGLASGERHLLDPFGGLRALLGPHLVLARIEVLDAEGAVAIGVGTLAFGAHDLHHGVRHRGAALVVDVTRDHPAALERQHHVLTGIDVTLRGGREAACRRVEEVGGAAERRDHEAAVASAHGAADTADLELRERHHRDPREGTVARRSHRAAHLDRGARVISTGESLAPPIATLDAALTAIPGARAHTR
jgi:hypothetical protein